MTTPSSSCSVTMATTSRIRQRSAPTKSTILSSKHCYCLLLGLFSLLHASAANNLRGPPQEEQQPPLLGIQHDRQLLEPSSRIVGGSAVRNGAHPYFAQWEGALCGGAVIHDDIVISAAHCFDPANPPASRRLYLNSILRNQGLEARYVHTEVHPLYDKSSTAFDFVLIKTARSMLTNGVNPTGVEKIGLNRDWDATEVDRPVLAVGYGQRTEQGTQLSPVLMDVLLYYVDSQTCANQYVERGKFNENVMFCTGVPGGGKDTCTGDSGGPLVDYRTRTLVGLVSWGEGCAREDYSGVNARISAVTDWIDQKICELSKFRPATCPSKVPPVSNAEEEETTITRPGGSAGAPTFPGQVEVGRDNGGEGSGGNSGAVEPLYRPNSQGQSSTLAAGSGVGGSSNANLAFEFPGESPKQATNAVQINVYYNANSQRVLWTLDVENEEKEVWDRLFTSPRGYDGRLIKDSFLQLPSGWYRFQLKDERANSGMTARDYSLRWMSIMGPRGDEIFGKEANLTQTEYNVYFEVDANGIPTLGSRPNEQPGTFVGADGMERSRCPDC